MNIDDTVYSFESANGEIRLAWIREVTGHSITRKTSTRRFEIAVMDSHMRRAIVVDSFPFAELADQYLARAGYKRHRSSEETRLRARMLQTKRERTQLGEDTL